MRPAQFTQTDRGLQVLESVKENSIIVSIPIDCCLTRYTVSKSHIFATLGDNFKQFSTQALLATWLALNYEEDAWKPYIHSLPTEYPLPMFYSKLEKEALPLYIRDTVERQTENLTSSYNRLRSYFPSLDFDRYSWGFATVNTRAVYLDRDPRDVDGKGENGDDALALVPFLDLLNHSDDVSVEAGINLSQKSSEEYFYEIRLAASVARYQEAFICYGKHSNTKLLLEYGFFLGSQNKNEHISISTNEIIAFLLTIIKDITQYECKLNILRKNQLDSHLAISDSGMSWNLRAAFYILLLDATKLKQWHSVYQLEEFKDLNDVFRKFFRHKLADLQVSLADMQRIDAPSKHFHLAIELVKFHINLMEKLITYKCNSV